MKRRHSMAQVLRAMAVAASIATLAAPAASAMTGTRSGGTDGSDVVDRYVANLGGHAATSGGYRVVTDTLGGSGTAAGLPWSSGAAAVRGGFDSAREATTARHNGSSPDVVDRYIAGRSSVAEQARGYRFVVDTLAPGGGPAVVSPGVDRFSWRDAGVGVAGAFALLATLFGVRFLLQRRRPVAV
jgi:hypothetical protein